MRNIHVLPTNKPSSLYSFYGMLEDLSNGKTFTIVNEEIAKINLHKDLKDFQENIIKAGWIAENIYITSDEKPKEGDYVITPTNDIIQWAKVFQPIGKKIILTNDPKLIADGVQAIDDEFLEWFVNNSSCEYVEVRKTWEFLGDDYRRGGERTLVYEIIIPSEKPLLDKVGEKFLESTDTIISIVRPKQETLEEAAERKFPFTNDDSENRLITIKRLFWIDGAKWQAKSMYSEEDMKQAFFDGIRVTGEGYNGEYASGNHPDIEVEFYESYTKWFNKFKKK
jgi:hypothetical protein